MGLYPFPPVCVCVCATGPGAALNLYVNLIKSFSRPVKKREFFFVGVERSRRHCWGEGCGEDDDHGAALSPSACDNDTDEERVY